MPKLTEIVNYEYQGQAVAFLPKSGDAMVNATQMCKNFGKEVKHFLELQSTKTLIAALEARGRDLRPRNNTIIHIQQGGHPAQQGTWVNRVLAMELAGWLNVDFKLWVYDVLEVLLTHGEVKLEMTAPSPKKIKPNPRKKRVIRRVKPQDLSQMLYDLCQIDDDAVRKRLAEQLYHGTRC